MPRAKNRTVQDPETEPQTEPQAEQSDKEILADLEQERQARLEAEGQVRQMQAQGATRADPGEFRAPSGAFHEFDPEKPVEIGLVPHKQPDGTVVHQPSKILAYTPPGATRAAYFAPDYDELERAHYNLPRDFAAAQLRNAGGMRFVLVFPKRLTVLMRRKDGTRAYVTLTADETWRPVFKH
jgi:hypothetical protein